MHIGIVGLGFGREFVPIYQAHPLVERVTICDKNPELLSRTSQEFSAESAADLDDLLKDPSVDAIHILTPLPLHADQTVATLESGKHCACAVTMATTLPDVRRIVDVARASGKVYMMMETCVYTKEFLFARDLVRSGELGPITMMRGDYFQDLEAPYAPYWRNTPPMHYATHSLAPLLSLAQTRASRVACIGSGRIRPDICQDPRNPFPAQMALFELENHPAAARIDRAWYQTAHQYVEAFSVYGEKKGFEWQQLAHEDPVVFELEPAQTERRWRDASAIRVETPYRPDLLLPELTPFAQGGHAGAHPHLVQEFLAAIAEGRKAAIHEQVAADWCAPGICAHESSLRGGEWIDIPRYDA